MNRIPTTMNRRQAISILVGAPIALSIPITWAKSVNMRIASVNAPTNLSVQMAEEVGKRIAERTNGRLDFQMFPSAQLGTTTDSVEQASQGQQVITYASSSFLAGFGVPELAAVEGPFVIANNEEGERLAFSDLMQGYYDKLAATSGIRVIALNWFDGARHMIGSEPYPEPSDLQGVKMRVPPIDTWLKTFEPLGVIATTVEAAEAYSALSQGVVTAGESPLLGLRASKWYEVVKEITLTGHFNLFTGWVMSEAVAQSLSDEDRAILMEEFRRGGKELSDKSAALESDIRKEFEAAGVTFHNADLPAYQKATAGYYDSYPDGLIDTIRAAANGA